MSGVTSLNSDFNQIRNYYAHRSEYLRLCAREVALKYGNPVPPHPVDVVFQIHPSLNLPLWAAWLEEMELIVDNMVN